MKPRKGQEIRYTRCGLYVERIGGKTMTETRELHAGDGDAAVARPPRLQPPDLETLIEWEAEGGCEAACPYGCWIEPDGYCSHHHPSWLIVLGLI
jgi:hypothetical protein